jgi:PIN domain nuclease of toxin-antitoxin system
VKNLLFDTHVLIWSQQEPERLGSATRRALLDPTNPRAFHTISTLEIGRLAAGGQLVFRTDPWTWIKGALGALRCQTLELTHEDALGAYGLPEPFHRDPCDRILVAAARHRGLTLLTADERILGYRNVSSLDARR